MSRINMSVYNYTSLFGFISRIIYSLENNCIDDPYNRRIEKSSLDYKDEIAVGMWYNFNFGISDTECCKNIKKIYDLPIKSSIENKYDKVVVFIVNELDIINGILDIHNFIIDLSSIFDDESNHKYVFIPSNFIDLSTHVKIDNLRTIFAGLLAKENMTVSALSVATLSANLIYEDNDSEMDDIIKSTIQNIMEHSIDPSSKFINLVCTPTLKEDLFKLCMKDEKVSMW